MGRTTGRVRLSRFERYGMAYSWSALPLLMLILALGPLVRGPGIPICVGLVVAYILTGFGLLASLALRPWLGSHRRKPPHTLPVVSSPLWDRQVDG